jgi:hypothetical protein
MPTTGNKVIGKDETAIRGISPEGRGVEGVSHTGFGLNPDGEMISVLRELTTHEIAIRNLCGDENAVRRRSLELRSGMLNPPLGSST